MPTVYNWQIGREMWYPFEYEAPQRQFSAVFDLNRCIGCQTCTLSCKSTWTTERGQEHMFWNNVETKPYGGHPVNYEARTLRLLGDQPWEDGVYRGKTVFEAAPAGRAAIGYLPEDVDWASYNLGEDEVSGLVEEGDFYELPHEVWQFYMPRICNHCTLPACLASCPIKAIYKRSEDGIVLVDQDRCRAYRDCERACPYKKVLYNPVSKVANKCIGCYPKVEAGEQPMCTITCIGHIRMNGWIHEPEESDPENLVDYLVHERKVALPHYPQFGLKMNIYYIPPIHVPVHYLGQMFGPNVREAIETYRKIPWDQELLGALLLFGSTKRWIHRFRVKAGYAYGYDEKGSEIVRVPLKEPSYIRPLFDQVHQTFRQNTT